VRVHRVFGGDRIKNLMVAFRVEDLPDGEPDAD